MNFSDLGLKPELVTAVTEKGYSTPTPIQLAAIPAVLAGRDVRAAAQTGTGKTAGFVLPILQKLGARKGTAPRALILAPTRELASQIAQSVRDYGKNTNLRSLVIFGGVSERPQINDLRHGCDLIVATPGRLLDLANQKAVSLAEVEVFVLDEADRMLDMGFIHDIKRVRALLPKQRQNLLFSATYSADMRQLAENLLHNPLVVEVSTANRTADKVEQVSYRLPKEHKRHLLAHLINEGNWHQVLVFTRTKHGANRLADQLTRAGITSMPIHGNKSQNARTRALADFKDNKIIALVATEIAARGLDIKELPYVVNYELPNVPEDYVHRIGRTARAGSTGMAVSLVSPDEAPYLKDIIKLLGKDIPSLPLPAFKIESGHANAPGGDDAGGDRDPRDGGQRGRPGVRAPVRQVDAGRGGQRPGGSQPRRGTRYVQGAKTAPRPNGPRR
jgi:ATP-dependent RNA helicase RhlE